MGCDIHCYAEVRKDGRWSKVGPVFDDPYYLSDDPEDEWNVPKTDQVYCLRNYNLFAILADVRNGYGFAGCDTGDGFIPISPPRGLPADVSDEVRKISDDWGADGHSHSWFTLHELRSASWGSTTHHRGVVDADQFQVWREKGKPESWCGGVAGPDVEIVPADEMVRRIEGGSAGPHCFTRIEWSETYRDSVGRPWFEALDALTALAPDPSDVRIVFFFDN